MRAPAGNGPGNAPSRVRLLVATSALLLGGSPTAYACPMCFGAQETSMIDGTKLGVLVMLGITLVVQGAFVSFFLYLRRRAKRHAEIELETEWSHLQRASRTS
jgi:heme/copper-type cytochrome/quinol oxidase subunit 2